MRAKRKVSGVFAGSPRSRALLLFFLNNAMAYLRFSKNCEWYVFDEAQKGEAESRLAVRHKDHKEQGASYTADTIRKMLESGDYSIIPGVSTAP